VKAGSPVPQVSFFPLKSNPLCTAVERVVSEHTGRKWTARAARDMTDFACHPSAILSDGSYSVFAKFSEAANGIEQFEIEMAGLRLLSERSGVLTPTPIRIIPVAGGSVLVLEAVQEVARAPRHWRQIGHTLARIHKIKGNRFGLETHGYFGPLYQDNAPMSDWPTFYVERRLLPGLRLAIDSGNMPRALMRNVETLISRVPQLCGPETAPSLLHGDAQQNNFISTEMGAVVIDPAVYYGNPEMDLAAIDYWQAVPDDVLDGYQDELTIDPGFWERRDLWRVWGYLAAVTVEGPGYLGKLAEAVKKYV
jgi:protein-ribulosamine 3-kinase